MQYIGLHTNARGFSLVELLVTAAIVSLVFGGLLGSIQFALKLISGSKASASALALANEQLEYIRSLSYADVGTVGGIPSGSIPQNSTTTLNGMVFYERVFIQYIDSPDDGLGGADSNGILADYKQAKVEYSWSGHTGTSSIFLLTNIIPPGIESTTGGGTLTVNVFDAAVAPVSGAEVHIHNNTTTTTIDIARFTNAEGIATFAGAPAAANYEITVTKTGYSTDQTYVATTSNPDPITSPVAVIESAVSTMNFQIDRLSDLKVRTIGPATVGSFEDTFTDMTAVATSTDVALVAGSIVLGGSAGTYIPTGLLHSTTTTPTVITAWDIVSWNSLTPINTELLVSVYKVTGSTYSLVPDADLAGNSVGFSSGPIDISGLDTSVYDSLALGAVLTTTDSNVTPELYDWSISHTVSEPSIGSIPFTLTSTKIIGTTPVYKYLESHTTDASGEVELTDLEWDSYIVALETGAYDIKNACPSIPYTLNPGVSDTLTLTLVPSATYSLRVSVVDVDGNPIIGADVDVSRPSFSDSDVTSSCGQVFFNTGLAAQPDYELDVQATGYVDQTVTGVTVDGTNAITVTLTAV